MTEAAKPAGQQFMRNKVGDACKSKMKEKNAWIQMHEDMLVWFLKVKGDKQRRRWIFVPFHALSTVLNACRHDEVRLMLVQNAPESFLFSFPPLQDSDHKLERLLTVTDVEPSAGESVTWLTLMSSTSSFETKTPRPADAMLPHWTADEEKDGAPLIDDSCCCWCWNVFGGGGGWSRQASSQIICLFVKAFPRWHQVRLPEQQWEKNTQETLNSLVLQLEDQMIPECFFKRQAWFFLVWREPSNIISPL